MSRLFRNLIWVPCALSLLSAQAQVPANLQLDYNDGLPSNEVYDIFQDSAGFIWFTTDNGIVRFDGGEMKTLGTADGLTDPVVFGIHEDKRHRLWLRTYSGQLAWLSNDTIRPYAHNSVLRNVARKSIVQNIVMSDDGSLHFSAAYYMGKVDHAGRLHLDSIKSPGMLCRIVNNTALLAYYGGTWLIPSINIDGKEYRLEQPTNLVRSHVVTSIKWKGYWWFSVNNALLRYDGTSLTRALVTQSAIFSLSLDRNDHLCIGYGSQGAEKFSSTDFRSPVRLIEPGVSVTRVLQDNEGGYWFSTLERGVLYVPHLNVQRIPLPGGKIRAAIEHQGKLLLGDQTGRLLMLEPSGTLSEIRKLPYSVLTAFRDKRGMLWLSTSFDTYILDENLREELTLPRISKVSFSESPNGKIWGTGASNTRFDKNGKVEAHHYRSNSRSIFATDSLIYLGGRVGLGLYDSAFHLKTELSDLAQHKIIRMLPLSQHQLTLATMGGGLLSLDLRTRQVKSCGPLPFDQRNVLAMTVVDSMLVISTDRGVFSASIRQVLDAKPVFRSVLGHPALTSRVEHLVMTKNHLYAVDNQGVTIVPAETDLRLNTEPKFYLKEILINDKPLSEPTTTLSAGQNFIVVRYGFLAFNNRNIFVRFRLHESDPWQTGNTSQIELLSPGTGKYKIELQYSPDGEHWKSAWRGFAFEILPPLWRSGYFISALVVLTAAIVAFINYFRIRILRGRQQMLRAENELQSRRLNYELEAIEKERSRVAGELHDGVSSHLQAVRLAVLRESTEKDSLNQLLDETLAEVKTIIHDLSPPSLQHFGLLAALTNYVDRINKALPGSITYVSSGNEVSDVKLKRYAFRIVQELVTNALRHTASGKMTIHVTTMPGAISIIFEDHGGGIPVQSGVKGLGLLNIESRIHALGGHYHVESDSTGTTFAIELPIAS